MTAMELERCGFVNGIFEENELMPKVLEIAESLAQSPRQSLINSKKVSPKPFNTDYFIAYQQS